MDVKENIAFALLSDEWGGVQPLRHVFEELERHGYIIQAPTSTANLPFRHMKILKDFFIKGYKFDSGSSITDRDIEGQYFRYPKRKRQ